MTLLWLAALLVAVGWVELLPTVGAPRTSLGVVEIVCAAAATGVALRRVRVRLRARTRLLLIAAGIAAIAVLPFPYGLGLFLVALASGLLWLPAPRPPALLQGAIAALGGVGLALAVLGALSPVYFLVAARVHELGPLTYPVSWALRLLAQHASADPPFVHLGAVGGVVTFDVSLEKLGGYPLLCFVAVAALLVFLAGGRRSWSALFALLGLGAIYGLLRLLLLSLLQQGGEIPEIYYNRVWDCGGLAVLCGFCVLALVVRGGAVVDAQTVGEQGAPAASGGPAAAARRPDRELTLALLSAALALAVVGAYGYQDPGHPKRGRVMIDEAHSNWEWSTIALDTESYGVQTVYNYSEMMRYFGHYYEDITNFDSLTTDVLAKTDVLILKTPTRPYAEAEVDAIVRFVEQGGGLWLVGDHTNIFGMSSNLNRVARRFGMRYNYNAVVDLLTRGRQLYLHPRLLAHPAVINMPPLLLATSCSMQAPLSSRDVMIGQSLLADQLDYSQNTFFGNFAPDPFEPFGTILQSAATTRGKGRVLLFSDSTVFSNFFMFIQGKAELALGSVAWLMRENHTTWVPPFLAACALLLAIAAATLAARLNRLRALTAALGPGALAFIVGALLLTAQTKRAYPLPSPHQEPPWIAFERGHCSYGLPETHEIPDNSAESHQTFYVWTGRVGYMPFTAPLAQCLQRARILVLVNPRDPFDTASRDAIERFVRDGGRLLVFDSPHVGQVQIREHGQERSATIGTTANDLLPAFGIRMLGAEVDSVVAISTATKDSVTMLYHVGALEGGTPLLTRPDGTPILVVADHGRGKVAAICASDSFTDAVLGTTSQIPSPEQLALYRIEFSLLDDVLRPPDVPRPVRTPPPVRPSSSARTSFAPAGAPAGAPAATPGTTPTPVPSGPNAPAARIPAQTPR